MESLKDLLKPNKEITLKNKGNPKILGLTMNSKKVRHGDLYVAVCGQKFDGRDFCEEAIRGGACAIITDLYNPLLSDKVPQVITKNPAKLGMDLALKLYQKPEIMIGVTGTNGKTTTCFMVQSLLQNLNEKCALVGTCLIDTLLYKVVSKLTTPDGIELARYLSDAKKGGAKVCAMEVSSHALDQKRILGHTFDIAIFTNITHDHLDYHKTFEAYKSAKARLFSKEYLKPSGLCVINLDDPFSSELIKNAPYRVLSYSLNNPSSDLYLENTKTSKEGTFGRLHYQNSVFDFFIPMVGLFNASNALCAVASALHLGFGMTDILEGLKILKGAPGRLEKVSSNIFIDYAHTPDGLESVLKTMKQLDYKKVHVLFGCGGDRDKLKRPKMGQIAQEFADHIVITSDNPRSEDPSSIIEEIKGGLSLYENVKVFIDRKEAIYHAIDALKEDEVLVLCGKGHEKTQIIGPHVIEFDEEKIVKERLFSK